FLIRGGLHRFPRAMNWFGLPATYAAAFAEARSILRESVSNRPTAIRQLCAQRASKMAGSFTLSLVVFLDSVHPDTLLIQLGRSACPANSALMPLVRRHLAPNTWHLLLNPLERALLPGPYVTHHQDQQEDEHFGYAEPAEGAVFDRPRKQEDRFHVEDHKQDGDDVEAYGIPAARIGSRLDAALVGFKLGLERSRWADQLGDENCRHRKSDGDGEEYEDGNIAARHRSDHNIMVR